MVREVWIQYGSGDVANRITFGYFLFLSSLLLFFGSQPGTNGISMGFYHLPLEEEIHCMLDLLKGHH